MNASSNPAGSASRRRVPLALLIAPIVAAPLAAQPDAAAGEFGSRVDVEVVDVDVVVTDRQGNRILDLAREAFELRVDGRPMAIEHFRAPRAAIPANDGAVELEAASAPDAVRPSYLIAYVDQSALRPDQRDRAVEELREFVRRRRPGELVAVAAFEERLHLLAPPTADSAVIEAAFDQLLRLPLSATLSIAERRQLESVVRRRRGSIHAVDTGVSAVRGRALEGRSGILEPEIRRWSEEELERERRSVAGLGQLVGAFAALEGRKSVVVATAGTTTESGAALLEACGTSVWMASLDGTKQRLRDEFEAVVGDARDARVALYAARPADDPAALGGADLRVGAGTRASDPSLADAALSVARLTAATGGRSFLLSRELDMTLDEVRDDDDAVYSLGFATGPAAGFDEHRIEVLVGDPRFTVRHREGFRRRNADERAAQALYAAATLGEHVDPLGISLETGEARRLRERSGDRLLPVAARVPLGALALLPEGGARHGRLTIRWALQGERGDLWLSEPETVPIAIPEADLERALGSVWVHRSEVRTAPSIRRVAMVVVDEIAGIHATRSAAVAAPARQ